MRVTSANRSQQIVDAAAACFAQKGFHQTTMDDIARAAGISAGLIYRHFASKEDLIVALVEQHEQAQQQQVAQAHATPTLGQAFEVLFTAGSAGGDWQAEGALLVEVVAEAMRNQRVAAVVGRYDAALLHSLAAIIAQAQARGQADPTLDATVAAELLLALNDGMMLRLAFMRQDEPVDSTAFDATLQTLFTRFFQLKETDAPGDCP